MCLFSQGLGGSECELELTLAAYLDLTNHRHTFFKTENNPSSCQTLMSALKGLEHMKIIL